MQDDKPLNFVAQVGTTTIHSSFNATLADLEILYDKTPKPFDLDAHIPLSSHIVINTIFAADENLVWTLTARD